MFGLFKSNPVKKLEKHYADQMAKAMQVQRSGDLKLYAKLIEEAEAAADKIQAAKSQQ